jgi:hypothetical protein
VLPQAVEQYEALRAKEAEQVAELDAAREEAKAAMAAFNDLSSRRYDLFMAAFDHVAAHIDPIFKVRLQRAQGRGTRCPAVQLGDLPRRSVSSAACRGYTHDTIRTFASSGLSFGEPQPPA